MKEETLTLHVAGMHCKACTILIEDALKDLPMVKEVHADLSSGSVTVTGCFGDLSREAIAERLTAPVETHGYTIAATAAPHKEHTRDLLYAIPIALGFLGVFVFLQHIGLINLISGGELSTGGVFLIGVIASLSTCMAVVGGLLLSLSATFAKEGDAVRPQLYFHGGRLVSFFVLGGVIGVLGTAFTLSTTATFVLNLLIGVVMLLLGVNLLDVFSSAKRFQFTLPRVFSRHVQQFSRMNHSLTPFLVGVATFFLPCGFTQSMQLYTLEAGGFWQGGRTMFVFALGTLPVLALMSFSSFTVAGGRHKGVFFKTAGLIVIAFALMSIVNSFVIMGVITPVFTF